MTTSNTPTLTITGCGDLLTAVPYLLGFHPHESLVLIGLAEHRLVVTARLDLTDAEGETCVLGDAVAAIVRGGADQLVGAVYTGVLPHDGRLPHDGVATALVRVLDTAAAVLVDCVLVAGGRWWSYTCQDVSCCPMQGTALPIVTSVFEAQATYAGITVAPDRGALGQRFAQSADREALRALVTDAVEEAAAAHADRRASYERSATRAVFAAARVAADPQHPTYPSDADAARFGAALTSIAIRDSVWLACDQGRLDGAALWLDLARRLPAPYDAAPLFLYGWESWRAGNGAVAGIAAQRALAADPGYSAADLLLAALTSGVNPRVMPKLRVSRTAGPRPAL